MEKAKISALQLFFLILLFELGSALLVPLAIDAKQDAWISILLAMVGGIFIFFIYYRLYLYYPNMLPTTYVQKIIGVFFGRVVAFIYIVFFLYLAARILRDFGEMLAVVGYRETPISVDNLLLILVVVYSVRKGIEVLARSGEIFSLFIYFLAISGFVLVMYSKLIELDKLKPILEYGIMPVLRVTLTQVIFFPFGEVFVFSMILPYLNNPKKARITGILALVLCGINLSIVMAVNISVLGVDGVSRSLFPLLSTIQTINLGFLERLDIFFMLPLIILGFFKISIYVYAAIIGIADLFNIARPSKLAFPIGFVVWLFSIAIASNVTEHMQEGLNIVPLYFQLPFQVIFPLFILMIAFFKNK
ncbi:GerAB/ArcD/ProY family transporter [Lederbergia panacisoli]|uniref:GerAB/ArcD/ProY family transporter n=1 Tax=Lederbergia panacisoli TaxID=1255251 RepID=UPI00214C085F|nr:spore germination protein [Lederbergia panacisoli]MCR2821551.1 spore germination protein [Lederbergia panacisoli]